MQPFNSRWVVSDWDTSASDMRWCCVLSRYTRKLFFSHERIRVYVGCLIENGEDIQIHCGIRIESLASLEWRQCNKIRLFGMQIHIPAIKLILDRMLCDLCVCVFKSVYCKIRDQCLISAGFFFLDTIWCWIGTLGWWLLTAPLFCWLQIKSSLSDQLNKKQSVKAHSIMLRRPYTF